MLCICPLYEDLTYKVYSIVLRQAWCWWITLSHYEASKLQLANIAVLVKSKPNLNASPV